LPSIFKKPFLFLLLATLAFVGAGIVSNNTRYHPYAQVKNVPGNVNIQLLLNGRAQKGTCETLIANVTTSILTFCPKCQIEDQKCLTALSAEQQKLLSAESLDVPSLRLPDGGVVTYQAPNLNFALAACQEGQRQIPSQAGSARVVCYAPKAARPIEVPKLGTESTFRSSFSLLLLALGSLALSYAFYLLCSSNNFHERVRSLPRSAKRLIIMGFDMSLLAAALLATLLVRHDFVGPTSTGVGHIFSLELLIALPVFIGLGLYRNVVRYMSAKVLIIIAGSVTMTLILLSTLTSVLEIPRLSADDLILHWLFALLFIAGSRILAGEFLRERISSSEPAERVIIYGAGDAGAQLAISLKGKSGLKPVAFVDDNRDLSGSLLYGIKVYSANQLPKLVTDLEVRQILLAIPSVSKQRLKEVFDTIEHLGVRIRTIPRFSALIEGRAKISDIEDVHIEALLGRDPVPPLPGLLAQCIKGKVVLVTGAGGSIGAELCRQIESLGPTKLILLEQSEFALYLIHEELIGKAHLSGYSMEIVPVLASVTSELLLRRTLATHRVNTIYHAAAYKHVPLVESNPGEAIYNNVIGSLRVAAAANAENVDTFVMISTDKAVRPTSIMGASKRMAELVMQGIRGGKTKYCIVRFGNVLESSGSVVPLFRKQILEGGPITVTHPEITRYFMTIPEAAQLVLQAGSMAAGGDVFVLDMGSPVRIVDLARRMIHLSGLTIRDNEHPNGHIEIKFTGLRPGEKLYEELLIGDNATGTAHPLIMRAMEDSMDWGKLSPLLESLEQACGKSNETQALSILQSVVPLIQNGSSARPHI
jgi:FlaA1/EpsC-like NDP-sugar epimerase